MSYWQFSPCLSSPPWGVFQEKPPAITSWTVSHCPPAEYLQAQLCSTCLDLYPNQTTASRSCLQETAACCQSLRRFCPYPASACLCSCPVLGSPPISSPSASIRCGKAPQSQKSPIGPRKLKKVALFLRSFEAAPQIPKSRARTLPGSGLKKLYNRISSPLIEEDKWFAIRQFALFLFLSSPFLQKNKGKDPPPL